MMKTRVTLLFFFVCCIGVLGIPLSQHAQAGETAEPRPFDNLFVLRDTKTVRISSYDRAGGNEDFIKIEPGETKTIAEISGTVIIRRFYVAPPCAGDRMRSRKLIVRMYWDGEKEPCVEVPLGDFFGSGLGTLRHFHSAAVDPGFDGFDFDGMVSYLPMPFDKGARITVENDSDMKDYILYYHIEYEQYPDGKLPPFGPLSCTVAPCRQDAGEARPEKNTQEGGGSNLTGTDNYATLDAAGRGTYVGLFLTVDNLPGGWYAEAMT